ncbi:MAG TPA: hypothetical protein VF188_11705 [Longimicrobiales bacterium]
MTPSGATPSIDDERVARVAAGQHGVVTRAHRVAAGQHDVVTRAQLLGAGLSPDRVDG